MQALLCDFRTLEKVRSGEMVWEVDLRLGVGVVDGLAEVWEGGWRGVLRGLRW